MSNRDNNPKQDANQLPEPIEFFTSVPLYQTATFAGEADAVVLKIVSFNGTLEFYCPQCQQSAIFISAVAERMRGAVPFVSTGYSSPPEPRVSSGIHTTKFHCSRQHGHILQFMFLVEEDYFSDSKEFRLTKIGQYPSLAELTAGELKKYRKILSSDDYKELARAVGLVTHGIGIGSFVYLRRIFERLVEEAHQLAMSYPNWNEDDYVRSRMGEKIKLLESHLPSFLSDNWQIYGILSKGVHELSEEDCLAHFDILKGGIELILDQKIEEKERQAKASQLKNAIQKIAGSMR